MFKLPAVGNYDRNNRRQEDPQDYMLLYRSDDGELAEKTDNICLKTSVEPMELPGNRSFQCNGTYAEKTPVVKILDQQLPGEVYHAESETHSGISGDVTDNVHQ